MFSVVSIMGSRKGSHINASNTNCARGPSRPDALAKGIAGVFADHEVVGSAEGEAMVRHRVSGWQ